MYGRLSMPRNTSLNCTMPALVNSSVGSLPGTRLEAHDRVALGLEELQELVADVGGFHGGMPRGVRPRVSIHSDG